MKKIIKAFSLILVIACISNKTSAQLASEAPAKAAELNNKNALTTTSKLPDVQTASSVAPGKTKTIDATVKPVVTNNVKPATLASSDDGLSQTTVKPATKAADKKTEPSGSIAPPVKKEAAKPVAAPTGLQSTNG